MAESVNSKNIFDLLEDEAPSVGMPVPPEENAPRTSGKSARGKAHTRGAERSAAAAVRPGKREYDRHSATGQSKQAMKKGGHGKGNWGSLKDAENDGIEVVEAATTEAPVEEAPAAPEPTQKKQPQAEAPAEDDETAKLKTLEQYQAEVAKLSIDEEKKAREVVVDEKKFKKCEVLQEGGNDNPFADLVKKKSNNKKKGKKDKPATVNLDEFNRDIPLVEDERTRFEGRGRGRGGARGRGRGGRGAFNNSGDAAPVTADAAAAPEAAATPAAAPAAEAGAAAGATEAGAAPAGADTGRGRGRGRGRGGRGGRGGFGSDDGFRGRGRGGRGGRGRGGRGGFADNGDNGAGAGSRGGRGRGGRGRGGFEGRGRGGYRENRPNFVADDTAFPALSKTTSK